MKQSPRPLSTAFLLLALIATPLAAEMTRPPVSFYKQALDQAEVAQTIMPALDNAQLEAEAEQREATHTGPALPYRFAHPFQTTYGLDSGTWEILDDGSQLWRLRIHSKGALSLNFGFTSLELPTNAGLWIYNRAGDYVEGPYTAHHISPDGQLWTPIIHGDEAVIELHLPAGAEHPTFEIGAVNHAFRPLLRKQGSCNIDVICPEGDPWRDQIRSAAYYSLLGFDQCSGQLVNNTAQDGTPYFLSAEHCSVNSGNASTMVFYWNYESPVCGQLSGGSLADNQSGATFVASYDPSDFLLVRLNQTPAQSSNVYYAGWDATGSAPSGSVGIHHPSTDEKAISFNDNALLTSGFGVPGTTHWLVDNWEQGTTEGGSSGSCIYDPNSKLCVGVLTGGRAACSNNLEDYYGKLSVSWNGGGAPSSRLRDWLDPTNSGVQTLAGYDPANGGGGDDDDDDDNGGPCVPGNNTLCLNGGRFKVDIGWRKPDNSTGVGTVRDIGIDDSGLMWFFDANNMEVLIKVLDGCGINDRYWVFYAATTNVEFNIEVTDTQTNTVKSYTNPQGRLAPAVADTEAFATCP